MVGKTETTQLVIKIITPFIEVRYNLKTKNKKSNGGKIEVIIYFYFVFKLILLVRSLKAVQVKPFKVTKYNFVFS